MIPTILVPRCPYCKQRAELVTGETIYPHIPELYGSCFWRCRPCQAWVGCHKNTCKPMGRLANTELRNARMAAHRVFDSLWKDHGWSRTKAYKWLAEQLDIPVEVCHIGMFDMEYCKHVIVISQKESKVA